VKPFVALLLVLLPCADAYAEQRALIVGVGRYVTPGIDLPGIDLDVERMRETLNRMGFSDSQIRTVTNEEATSTRVIAEMSGWLRNGVQAGDRVVFYYSGHGSQVPDANGDEDDGVDEVLVTHDMQRARRNGRATLTGVVVDDQIDEMVAKNPSRNVLLIVDACHSGTVSRSFSLKNRSLTSEPVFRKSFIYDGMPEPAPAALTRNVKPAGNVAGNYVLLAAAGDRESAIGTSRGGIFTIGMTTAIERDFAAGKPVTVRGLRDETAEFIKTKVDKADLYTPQITGSAELAAAPLRAANAAPLDGPNRRRLLDLVAKHPRKLELTPSRTQYAVDEPVRLSLNLPAAGYLNIVTVDARDGATVLFPNRLQESNAVQAGPFQLPTPQMKFDLLATEPTGPTLLVAFLSSEKINFYEETLDQRDENGNINTDFAALSHTATRAIRVAPRQAETWAGQVEVQIEKR
jgi:hypothetical protein